MLTRHAYLEVHLPLPKADGAKRSHDPDDVYATFAPDAWSNETEETRGEVNGEQHMGTRDTGKRSSGSSLAARREERRKARGQVDVADWASADPGAIQRLIAVVTGANGLCSFGYTRDGGTYTVTIILDGDKSTDYCRPTENIDEFLANLTDDFAEVG